MMQRFSRQLVYAFLLLAAGLLLVSCNGKDEEKKPMTRKDIVFLRESKPGAPDHVENYQIYLDEALSWNPELNAGDIAVQSHYLGNVSGYDIYSILPGSMKISPEHGYLQIHNYSLFSKHTSSPSVVGIYGFKDGRIFILEDLVYSNKVDIDYLFTRVLNRAVAENHVFAGIYTVVATPTHFYYFADYYQSRTGRPIEIRNTRFYYLGTNNDYALYMILPDVTYDSSLEKRSFMEYAYELNYSPTATDRQYAYFSGRLNTNFVELKPHNFTIRTPITGTVSDFNIYGYKDKQYFTIVQLLAQKSIDTQIFFQQLLPSELGGESDYYYNNWQE